MRNVAGGRSHGAREGGGSRGGGGGGWRRVPPVTTREGEETGRGR